MSEALFTEFFNQRLKERRLTLQSLSELSGISIKHLEQFAHGRFENLPAKPYLHGYFARLGPILGFDAEEWWSQVQREEKVHASGRRDILPANRYTVRRKRLLAGIGLVVLLCVAYFGFRAYKIIGKPELKASVASETTGEENITRTGESRILVSGEMKNGDEVLINGEQVPTETDGTFHKDVSLVPGQNSIEIVAKKILGRETKITKEVYYDASPIQILLPEAPTTHSTSSSQTASTSSSTP